MPQQYYYRKWCKPCNDYVLFYYPIILDKKEGEENKCICRTCKNEFEPSYLKDIPEEKINIQRERYKQYKSNKFKSLYGAYMTLGLSSLLLEGKQPVKIVECDAGQDRIDEIKKQRYEEQKQIIENQKIEAQKYKQLGRNETCLCGSNLKYKKCCYNKYDKYN